MHPHISAVADTHRVHTEWQIPIFGVHSIMMEKTAVAGEGGGARPPTIHLPSHRKLQCTLQLRGQIRTLCTLCWHPLLLKVPLRIPIVANLPGVADVPSFVGVLAVA